MRFGLSFLPDCTPKTKSASEYFRDAVDLSVQAEAGGLHSVKMTEHYLHAYGGYCPSPLAFLSAVAARTSTIRLMTGCVLPVFHHPVQLAAEAAQLDALSGGRLDVGFARAYLPDEFDTFGIALDESTDRFRETIRAVLRLWTEEDVTEQTPFFSYQGVTGLPRPTQHPHPPVWGAAVRTPESFAWLGTQGMGLLITPLLSSPATCADQLAGYRDAFQAAHGDSALRPTVTASLPLVVADSDEQATEIADHYLRRYLDVWALAVSPWDSRQSSAYQGYSGFGWFLRGLPPQRLYTEGAAVVGSPATVIERIEQFNDEVGGVDQIVWQIDFGAMPLAPARRTLELFCDKVLPYVKTL
ncbi:MAG TPA: LLM class flavin-dependent oxidoreductase [Kutzneria sp.]|jgi:alkanesulfonate monooxygenase SsuD/methylene tetrahydromethanopterin reductase-like flavin-dependent oxidoreductase (luciferase family)|nr:LLM class flavin-dependent oxidoreductase [Kutzneria sp.]